MTPALDTYQAIARAADLWLIPSWLRQLSELRQLPEVSA